MKPEPRPGQPRTARRRALTVAAIVVIAAVALAGLAWNRVSLTTDPTRSHQPSTTAVSERPIVGFASLDELRARAARAAAGSQPEAAAVADLQTWAATAMTEVPAPQEPLRIDGTTGPFVDDTATAYGLALAWAVTADHRDAVAARRFVMAWVDRTRTLENACATGGDCQTALIVSRNAPGFVFAMDLLRSSGAISDADDGAFREWLRTVILPVASQRQNNWGDAGVFLRVAATAELDDGVGWDAALAAWRSQLDLVASDGHIPEEVRRDSAGLQYTQEALLYKVAVAWIAERRGVDLWSYRGAGGATVDDAATYAARYLTDPTGWPWAASIDRPDVGALWELVYAHRADATVAGLLRSARPFGADGHSAIRWTTLTNGVPLAPGAGSAAHDRA